MKEHRTEAISEVIRSAVASYIDGESNKQSMITITNVHVASDFKSAVLFVTVFPEHKEAAAIDFLHRKRNDVRSHIKKQTRLPHIPFIDFSIDKGEKSRQRIEELSKEIE
jgi:ribosome-binding factor A